MDIDWVEFMFVDNEIRIIALIEEKHIMEPPMTDTQKNLYLEFSKTINVPVFEVRHNGYGDKEPSQFKVTNLFSEQFIKMNDREYRQFRSNMRRGKYNHLE